MSESTATQDHFLYAEDPETHDPPAFQAGLKPFLSPSSEFDKEARQGRILPTADDRQFLMAWKLASFGEIYLPVSGVFPNEEDQSD